MKLPEFCYPCLTESKAKQREFFNAPKGTYKLFFFSSSIGFLKNYNIMVLSEHTFVISNSENIKQQNVLQKGAVSIRKKEFLHWVNNEEINILDYHCFEYSQKEFYGILDEAVFSYCSENLPEFLL